MQLTLGIESGLKDLIKDCCHLPFTFETGTSGYRLLKAAKATLPIVANSYDEVEDLFKDESKKREFFEVVKQEARESGSGISFITNLDRLLSDDVTNGAIEPEIILFQGKLICNITKLPGKDIEEILEGSRKEKHAGDLETTLTKIINILEKGSGIRYDDISRVYHKNLAAIYEKVRTGKIRHWCDLTRGGIYFFDWEVNLRGVIRYVTKKYILSHYKCSLNDLPLMGGLQDQLINSKIWLRNRFDIIKDLFVCGHPEMKESPHWHPARWRRTISLPKEKEEEYFKVKRDYLFRHTLGCETKEDVKKALNDRERMKQALRKERMVEGVLSSDGYIKIPLYRLIEDLEGDMYNIDPWELKVDLPHETFRNPDGTINEEKVGKYLLWADRNYRLPLNNPREFRVTKHIPHYRLISLYFSASGIRGIYAEAKQKDMRQYVPLSSGLSLAE